MSTSDPHNCHHSCARLDIIRGASAESLFDTSVALQGGKVDVNTLLEGGRTLQLSSKTSWKWQTEETATIPAVRQQRDVRQGPQTEKRQNAQHLVLSTLVFPDSATSQLAPQPASIHFPSNASARNLPSTSNILSPISQDTSLAFSSSFDTVADTLRAIQELPAGPSTSQDNEDRKWTMKAARVNGHGQRPSYRAWLSDGWSSFVDLLKVSDTA